MRFVTWKIRSLYRAGSLTAAARELVKYKLDFVCEEEVKWDIRGIVKEGNYNFSPEKEMKIITWEKDSLYTTQQYQQLKE